MKKVITPKEQNRVNKWDLSYEGFAIAHEERRIYVYEATDAKIRGGDVALMRKALEIFVTYSDYSRATLGVMLVGRNK